MSARLTGFLYHPGEFRRLPGGKFTPRSHPRNVLKI